MTRLGLARQLVRRMAGSRPVAALRRAVRNSAPVAGPPVVGAEQERPEFGVLFFRCNICGASCRVPVAHLQRETPSCRECGSTVRLRSIIHMLSMELFGASLALPDFPARPDLIGLGLTDWEGYAAPLAGTLGYTNTYLHQAPQLDITAVDRGRAGSLDFLIASDVFEHVEPPAAVAFDNARLLLRPGGVLLFTVPYLPSSAATETKEHFPDLYQYRLVRQPDGAMILENTTREGAVTVYQDLVFHGGDGFTLEMRVFAEEALVKEFHRAGFRTVTIYHEPNFTHGIYHAEAWSLPIAARV